MRNLQKYLLVWFLIISIFLSSCTPNIITPTQVINNTTATAQMSTTSTLAPTSVRKDTKTPTPTTTFTATIEPPPTATSDPEISLEEEYEAALSEAGKEFIALTPEEADDISRKIGFRDGLYENAGNVCGPLSIAILKTAGFLPENISVRDIWLLNLRGENSQLNLLYRNYFPPQDYDYIWVKENVRHYDFEKNPLQIGDWLFLFEALNGFDHMLVVTSVDQDGAAYTVTNIDRGDGFIIVEDKLYDPNNPGEGLFYELTEPRQRRILGMTGTGGFLLVRRKGGLSTIPELNNKIKLELIDNVEWHVLIKDLNAEKVLFESYPNKSFHPASLIKIPAAMVAMDILEEQGVNVSDFEEKGFGGRTYEQLFYAMIVKSEEIATEIILDFIRANGGEKKILEKWEIFDTGFYPRKTTANDLGLVLEGLYHGELLSLSYNQYLLDLTKVYTDNDQYYLGVVTDVLPGSELLNKRGTLLKPTIVSDMGILIYDGRTYVIIISGSPKRDGVVTYEDIQESLEKFARQFGEGLKK